MFYHVKKAPWFDHAGHEEQRILSGPFFQRFFRQKIGKVFCPIHVELGTIGANPVFLRARPVGFPKRVAPSGIGNIHDFHHRNPLNVKRLSETEALHNR